MAGDVHGIAHAPRPAHRAAGVGSSAVGYPGVFVPLPRRLRLFAPGSRPTTSAASACWCRWRWRRSGGWGCSSCAATSPSRPGCGMSPTRGRAMSCCAFGAPGLCRADRPAARVPAGRACPIRPGQPVGGDRLCLVWADRPARSPAPARCLPRRSSMRIFSCACSGFRFNCCGPARRWFRLMRSFASCALSRSRLSARSPSFKPLASGGAAARDAARRAAQAGRCGAGGGAAAHRPRAARRDRPGADGDRPGAARRVHDAGIKMSTRHRPIYASWKAWPPAR